MESDWLTTPESTIYELESASDSAEFPLYLILVFITMVIIAIVTCVVYQERVKVLLRRLVPRYRVVDSRTPV